MFDIQYFKIVYDLFNTYSALYCVKGSVPATFMMETIMEHIAKHLNKDPLSVKELNFYGDYLNDKPDLFQFLV